jgi:hypothetical protein
LSEKNCHHCGAAVLRRVNRNGYLQNIVFPYFGYFPWECVMCRRLRFIRDDGHRVPVRGAI